MRDANWHLRFFLTPKCNFACVYCNPNRVYEKKMELSTSQAKSILQAAYNCGITKVHWTGGEPTVRNDLMVLMKFAKGIGYTEQIITTNGWNLHTILEQAINYGLTRVNISCDTLNEERFKNLTGMMCFDDVKRSIIESSQKVPGYVKINVVTMEKTLDELPEMIEFVKSLKNDKVILKLICFNPNNPAQLDKKGEELYGNSNVSFKRIYDRLLKIDELEYLENIEFGDNPNCEYYKLKNLSVIIGIIAEPSWNYKWGGAECRKLRITPFGEVANCIQDNLQSIADLSLEEQTGVILEKMKRKEIDDFSGIYRKHYRPQLGEMRFGKVSEPKELEDFERLTKV